MGPGRERFSGITNKLGLRKAHAQIAGERKPVLDIIEPVSAEFVSQLEISKESLATLSFRKDPKNASILNRLGKITTFVQNTAEHLNMTEIVNSEDGKDPKTYIHDLVVEVLKIDQDKTGHLRQNIGEEAPHVMFVIGPRNFERNTPQKMNDKANDVPAILHDTLFNALIILEGEDPKRKNPQPAVFRLEDLSNLSQKELESEITDPTEIVTSDELSALTRPKKRSGIIDSKRKPINFDVHDLKDLTNGKYHSVFTLRPSDNDPRKIYIILANEGLDTLSEDISYEVLTEIITFSPSLDMGSTGENFLKFTFQPAVETRSNTTQVSEMALRSHPALRR